MATPTRYAPETIQSYLGSGVWESETLASIWDRNAEQYSHKEAIVDPGKRLTWSQAKLATDRLALGFRKEGIERDELVVLQLPNSVELCLLRVAMEKAGILCLPVLRTYRRADLEYIIKHADAAGIVIPWKFSGFDHYKMVQEMQSEVLLRHIFVVGESAPTGTSSIEKMIENPLEKSYPPDYLENTRFRPSDVSMVGLTSGTTGFPKFVEQVNGACVAVGKSIAQRLGMTGDDVVAILPAGPFGPNNVGYWAAPWVGAKAVTLERFEVDEALRLIEREKVTVACVVPAQLAMILRQPDLQNYDLSSVRIWRCGGAPLPQQVAEEASGRLPGVVINGYGSVDSGAQFYNSPDSSRDVRLFTVGKPLDGHEARIVDESGHEVSHGEVGEIWLGGSVCSSGYYRDPEATWQCWTRDGWFKTGDLGKIDAAGNLVIVGRLKDIIIRGGQNIYPTEIENMLLAHPKVAEAAVVGMPDPVMGERACAYVVIKGGQTFTFDEMVSYLKSFNIVAYKLPERLEVIDKLPVVGDGKIDKKLLHQQIIRMLKAESGM